MRGVRGVKEQEGWVRGVRCEGCEVCERGV